MNPILNITITNQPTERAVGYFLGTAVINGASHHVELIRVKYEMGVGYTADGDEDNESRLDDLVQSCGGMPRETIEIDGHEYFVHITPFG